MTQLANSTMIGGQDVYTGSANQFHNVGEKMETRDGRIFRYGKSGSVTALTTGNLLQSPAIITNHLTLTPLVAALGATSVSVTLGATMATQNMYSGGYLMVNTTPGNGYAYEVSSHLVANASAALVVNITDTIQVATTAASIMDLYQNPYGGYGMLQYPVTATGTAIGACVFPLAVANWGWVQTHGAAGLLIQGTPAQGTIVSNSVTTAGSVGAGQTGDFTVGVMMKVGVSGKNNGVYLNID